MRQIILKLLLGVGIFGALLAFAGPAAAQAPAASAFTVEPPAEALTNVPRVITGIIQLIFLVAGILAFFFILFAGIKWITAGGDKGKVEEARNQIVQALVGLLIVVSSFALMLFFQEVTGVCVGFGNCSVPIPVLGSSTTPTPGAGESLNPPTTAQTSPQASPPSRSALTPFPRICDGTIIMRIIQLSPPAGGKIVRYDLPVSTEEGVTNNGQFTVFLNASDVQAIYSPSTLPEGPIVLPLLNDALRENDEVHLNSILQASVEQIVDQAQRQTIRENREMNFNSYLGSHLQTGIPAKLVDQTTGSPIEEINYADDCGRETYALPDGYRFRVYREITPGV